MVAVVCVAVGAVWLTAPQILVLILDIHAAARADVLGRRAGVLLLAVGGMLAASCRPRRTGTVAAVAGSGCAGLAALGLGEMLAGNVGAGILLAVGTETLLAALLVAFAIRTRSPRRSDEAPG